MAKLSAARLAALALQREGVDTVFYLLSAPIVADCIDLGMQAILTRNETAAGMMAHGYARVSGKPGVVLASHGPGTANIVPSLANAQADACPVIAFGASSAMRLRHLDDFQEMDQVLHQYAAKLARAAKNKNAELTVFYFYKMTDACLGCHTRYATHRFPDLKYGGPTRRQPH